MSRRVRLSLLLPLVAASTSACATARVDTRTTHMVDDELVYSMPVRSRDYEAYVRVRLAVERAGEGQQVDLGPARKDLETLLARRPRDHHLWMTKAELEHAAGDEAAASMALNEALALRPNYAPALALRSDWGSSAGPATASR